MPLTRNEIKDSIRHKLSAWPKVATTLNGAISATATSIVLSDSGTSVASGSLVEIDNETMLVKTQSANTLTVARGFHRTTKATHADTVDVNIYEPYGWTNNQLNLAINRAVEWLSTDPNPLWSFKFYSGSGANAWPSDTYELDIGNSIADWPNKGGYVLKLEFQTDDSPTKWENMSNFIQRKSIIRIAKYFSAARTFRVHLARFQPALTSDSDQLDVAAFETPAILYSCYWLLKDLQGSRAKFIEYSASLNERASTMDELLRIVYDFRNQASLEKRDAHQPMPKEIRRFFNGRGI